MKIVIANSIGIDSTGKYIIHSPSRWSEGVDRQENWFCYYPWELAYVSSLLKRECDAAITFIDGCLELLDKAQYAERIIAAAPDWLIMETATRTFEDNCQVACAVKQACGAKLVFVGQHASAFPAETLQAGIDYVAFGEYEYTILELVQGADPAGIEGLYPNQRRELLDIDSLPWPEDEDISRLSYGKPGEPSSDYLEIQMYAARGCPRSCNFCVARNLYYTSPNWRARDVNDVVAEISYLKEKYPQLEGIFFDEEEHNAQKAFILDLTSAIKAAGLDNLHYEAMCDIRSFDEDMLRAMRSAGYYQIRFGLESASEQVQEAINKKIDIRQAIETIKTAKRVGLKTYGTFMFGAPGASEVEDKKTVELLRMLIRNGLLDRVQISIATPQPGTPFYEQCQHEAWLQVADHAAFDGGARSIVSYPDYSHGDITRMAHYALSVRDHEQLVYNLKHPQRLVGWVRRIMRKQGIGAAGIKACMRLKKEITFLKGRS